MQATSLANAIDNFNELQPLVFREDDPRHDDPAASAEFYIEREDSPLAELKVHLLQSRGNEKILLTGHMGSGKSTELNRLAADPDIEQHFFVVKYGVRDVLNLIDIDYLDFLLSFGAVLFTQAIEGDIEFQPGTLDRISKWITFAKGEERALETLDAGRGKRQKAYNFFKQVLTILVREISLRQTVRNSIQRNLSELVEVINLTIDQIRASLPGGKELLVIIDDLEKIPDVERADRLFNQAGGYMVTPRCKIIYTLPIALYYSLTFQQIANTFSKAYFLRNINLSNEKGEEIPDGFTLLQTFLGKRLDPALMDTDAQRAAIQASGGVVRELVRITKDGIIKALARDRSGISQDLVNAAIIELRNEYSRGLLTHHFEVLHAAVNEQPVREKRILMELYHARVLLEYETSAGERWNAVNPMVQPLLDRYQRGLR